MNRAPKHGRSNPPNPWWPEYTVRDVEPDLQRTLPRSWDGKGCGSSLFPVGGRDQQNTTNRIKYPKNLVHEWASSMDESCKERLRLICRAEASAKAGRLRQ